MSHRHRTSRAAALAAALALTCASAGAQTTGKAEDSVVATVNGVEIRLSDVTDVQQTLAPPDWFAPWPRIARPDAVRDNREAPMPNGTVKWFNPAKGYGFIEPEEGETDTFVHISAVTAAGLSSLEPGQKLSYEIQEEEQGRKSAVDLKLLD